MTLRTLGEEFRKMGLLSEEDEGQLAGNASNNLLEHDDYYDEDDEELEEASRTIRTASGRKRIKKLTGAAKTKGKRYRKKNKAKLRRARGKAGAKRKRKIASKRHKRKYGMEDEAEMDDMGRQVLKKGESADRLDTLMGELQGLSNRFQNVQEDEDELEEDVAVAQRVYANIARVADALSQRIDEDDDLFDTFDGLADDALQIAEALANGEVSDLQKVLDAIPGYVKDLVGAVGQVSEELDDELENDGLDEDFEEDDDDFEDDDEFEDDGSW